MDPSNLSRPAISCQCSRCSSSLAALENEFAKLSESRAIAPGWMSVDLFRISIQPEQKRIPETSDLVVLRGRVTQEIRCRLCQQKVGALCALDNGPNIIWKLSKVSFREIVSMKTVPPCFKEEALERIISNDPSDDVRDEMGLIAPHSAQAQNPDIHYMNTLHDSLAELKRDFKSLRIKLDEPNQFPAEQSDKNGMVATLLLQTEMIGELRREVEALKQENEALRRENRAVKLDSRYIGMRTETLPRPLSVTETPDPDAQSSDLLQGSRKRPWADAFPAGHTQSIADSFESGEGDVGAQFTEDSQTQPMNMALEGQTNRPMTADSTTIGNAASDTPMLPVKENEELYRQQNSQIGLFEPRELNPGNHSQAEAIFKRPRLSDPTGMPSTGGTVTKRPGRGRPRKSETIPKPTPLTEQTGNMSAGPEANPAPPSRGTGRKRGRPPLKAQSTNGGSGAQNKAVASRRKSRQSAASDNDDNYIPPRDRSKASRDPKQGTSKGIPMTGTSMQNGSEKENPTPTAKGSQKGGNDRDATERQRELIARREREVRIAMRQEEAREMEAF